MRIVLHGNFEKQYRALRPGQKEKCSERLDLFLKDQFHPLKGTYKGYRSINVGGDLRAIYRLLDRETAVFVTIDTHGKLYS